MGITQAVAALRASHAEGASAPPLRAVSLRHVDAESCAFGPWVVEYDSGREVDGKREQFAAWAATPEEAMRKMIDAVRDHHRREIHHAQERLAAMEAALLVL